MKNYGNIQFKIGIAADAITEAILSIDETEDQDTIKGLSDISLRLQTLTSNISLKQAETIMEPPQ